MGLAVQVAIDCQDADRLAAFWATALDYRPEAPPPGFDTWPAFLEANGFALPPAGSVNAIVDPDGVGPRLLFQRVVAAGGTERRRASELGQSWVVMTDPEGNEFCVS